MQQSADWQHDALGAVCFTTANEGKCSWNTIELPCLQIPMRCLGDDSTICESWQSNGTYEQGSAGAIRYRYHHDVLFGVIVQSEDEFATDGELTPLRLAAESAYRHIFALLDTLKFSYPFRFWNYLADINGNSFGLERYRQFNLGRQDAFLAHSRSQTGNIPAACALGYPQGPLQIAFLAGKTAPTAIENPRQISAYEYPKQYGPSSPLFARACVARFEHGEVLFISGTASIVGHETLHQGDVTAQTRETLTNIEALLAEANRAMGQVKFRLSDLHCKVYVRNPGDLEQIQTELARYMGGSLDAIFLQADICRHDLLVEIEAIARYASHGIYARV